MEEKQKWPKTRPAAAASPGTCWKCKLRAADHKFRGAEVRSPYFNRLFLRPSLSLSWASKRSGQSHLDLSGDTTQKNCLCFMSPVQALWVHIRLSLTKSCHARTSRPCRGEGARTGLQGQELSGATGTHPQEPFCRRGEPGESPRQRRNRLFRCSGKSCSCFGKSIFLKDRSHLHC